MNIEKKQFRIGQLAQELAVERFVIRFWEKEFNIQSTRSEGGQRFYTELDLAKFKKIKNLLYDEGFTIAGAKKALDCPPNPMIGSHKTTMDVIVATPSDALANKLMLLKKQLTKLKEHLDN